VSSSSSLSSPLSIEASKHARSRSEPITWPAACKNGYKDRAGCVMSSLKELNRKRMNTHAELHCSRHAPLSSRERATDRQRFLSERQ